MNCPHCGKEQPISDACVQCGNDLFKAAPVRLTEELPADRAVKIVLLLSILLAAVGIYWIVEEAFRSPEPSLTETSLSQDSVQSTINEAIPPSPAPLPTVLALMRTETLDRQILQGFAASFSAKTTQVPIQAPNLVDLVQGQTFDWILTLHPDDVNRGQDLQKSLPQLVSTRHVFLKKVQIQGEKIFSLTRYLIRANQSKILLFYEQPTDEEAATILFGEALKAQYQPELVGVNNLRSLQEKLKALPESFAFSLVLESSLLNTPVAISKLMQFHQKKPLFALGNAYGKAGAIAEIVPNPEHVGTQLAQEMKNLINKPKVGQEDSPLEISIVTDRVLLTVFSRHARNVQQLQTAQLANALKSKDATVAVSIID